MTMAESIQRRNCKQKVETVKKMQTVLNGFYPSLNKKLIAQNPIADVYSEKHTQDTNSDDDSEPELIVGIPGGKAIFGSDVGVFRRTLWILLATACSIAAILQAQDRVSRYVRIPTRNEVRFERNDTLTFPWVTVCTREPFNYTTMERLRPLAAEKLQVDPGKVQLPYDLISLMPLDQLWRTIKNDLNVMALECWFRRGKTCRETGNWYEVMTALGPCFQFKAKNAMRETGLFNGLYMLFDGFQLTRPNCTESEPSYLDGWRFIVHAEQNESVLDISGKGGIMMPNSSLDVRIILRQVTTLNLERKPCNESATYYIHDCKMDCTKREFLANVGCLLPFMTPENGLLCKTPDQYRRADEFLKTLDSSADHADCNCVMPCYTSEYMWNQEKVLADVKPRRLRFRVFFQDTSFEQEIEEREYSLIGLFCDLGNTIGLLLGASVLTLVETIECGGLSLVRRFSRPSPGANRQQHRVKRRVHPGNPLTT